jgi:hypothetical protein
MFGNALSLLLSFWVNLSRVGFARRRLPKALRTDRRSNMTRMKSFGAFPELAP